MIQLSGQNLEKPTTDPEQELQALIQTFLSKNKEKIDNLKKTAGSEDYATFYSITEELSGLAKKYEKYFKENSKSKVDTRNGILPQEILQEIFDPSGEKLQELEKKV